ncbi:MAG: cell division protein ZapA, partial [Gammaproteobacteria bacterium]|nr:cell division protein ZapA [Gammaproteobacteria bacterium]
MKESSSGVTVNIFGKEFMIACPDDERDALLAAAN